MIIIKIKFSAHAKTDLKFAYEYYRSIEKQLGKRFKIEFYSKIDELKKIPASGSFMYENVRYRVLKTFPYIILYEINNIKQLTILRIFNTSQQPFW